MKGYRLTHGIWNRDHHIMSRDVGIPEVHLSMNNEIKDIMRSI